MDQTERDLRTAFAALRRENAAGAPSFAATLAGARSRAVRRRLPLFAVAATIAAALLLVVVLRDRRPGLTIDLATVRWEAPTDFLLALPGAELLRAVPPLAFTIDLDRRNP